MVISFGGFANNAIQCTDSITRQIELEFNKEAIENDAFITWELIGNWQEFTITINQGVLEENSFTVKAKDYKDFAKGFDGIRICIKPNKHTKEGTYQLSMKVSDISENLEFSKEELDLIIPEFYYQAPPPRPLWQYLVFGLLIAFLLFNIIWFALVKPNKYRKMNGTLIFDDGAAIKLNNCYKYCIYTAMTAPKLTKNGFLSNLYFGKVGKYGIINFPDYLRNENTNIIIKQVKDRNKWKNAVISHTNLQLISEYKKLYHEQDYVFQDSINPKAQISFTYDNIKHQL